MSTANGSSGSTSTPPQPPGAGGGPAGARKPDTGQTTPSSGTRRRLLTGLLGVLLGTLVVVGVVASVRMGDDADTQEPAPDKSLVTIDRQYITAVEGDMPVPNGSGEFLVDTIRARAWTTAWNEDLTTEPCTTRKGRSPGVELTFRPTVTLREFAIAPGLSETDPLRPGEWQPRTVELWWKGADCTHVELPNSTGIVRFPAPQGEVSGVVVRVVDAYPPARPEGSDGQLSLGEVSFWKR